ncbi:glycosyltransferase [Limosilactobacillus reuteri]|uniref:glycosyltransferase n=1 Tax=Limosilactobacillus reuteri TaxID=1598 RepID=UPI002740216E|nr:glycosyltransferase [Limosilactobacillus reuteri]WLR79622.1 glycosyltransferase [Limosilactobacillus reuteri]
MGKGKSYPNFSVLMSVYKNEKADYLNIALNSIENQTVKPSEIILVEDGPISNSLKKVILKHKQNFGTGFKIIKSPENIGLGAALRLGTKYVSTNWIARMDSDDYSVKNRFELQLELIAKNSQLAVIGGQVSEFSSNISNIIGTRKVPTTSELIYDFIKWRSPFNHPTVMINKKKLLQVGGYVPYGKLEDYYLWARIISHNFEVANLPMSLVYMRVDSGMYKRRGNYENLKFIFKLRRYLYRNRILNRNEEMLGDLIMLANLILPSWLRKIAYQHVLHKRGNEHAK